MPCAVTGFYRFASLPDCASLRAPLLDLGANLKIVGTVLISPEGVNGTVAGISRSVVEQFLKLITGDSRLHPLTRNDSETSDAPFKRLKVKVKKEIVTFRDPRGDPLNGVGMHVPAKEWNALISHPDVTLLDARNDFEVAAGTFEGAVDPGISSFSQFSTFADPRLDELRKSRVAMFCTGGIRCEKASAYLLSCGVKEVYQLEGGIVRYLQTMPANESLFRGNCFVFDDRTTIS